MKQLFEYAKQLNELCKNQEYQEVLNMYQNVLLRRYSNDSLSLSFLIINSVAEAYCFTNNWKKGIEFALKHVKALERMKAYRFIDNMGWLMIKALNGEPPHIKPAELNLEDMEYLLLTLKKYEECRQTAFILNSCWLKSLTKVTNLPMEVGKKFFQLFTITELEQHSDLELHDLQEAKEKKGDTSIEQWYLSYSKFLYNHQQWDECSRICREALDTAYPFANGGRVWLTRRLALSLRQQGDIGHAIVLMELLAKQKPDWYIQQELADLYLLQNDTDRALEYAALALHNGGYSEYKVNLLEFIGKVYDKRNDSKTAINFYYTAAFVRRSKGWPLSEELEKKVRGKAGVSSNPRVLYSILLQILPVKGETEKLLHGTGKITRILHESSNGDGFITDRQGNTIYFRFSQAKLKPEELKVGTPVKFKAKRIMHKGEWKWLATKVYPKSFDK